MTPADVDDPNLTLPVVPVREAYAASYRECLDVVARERRYLAQTEALPLERVREFVRDCVAGDAIQVFALDGVYFDAIQMRLLKDGA